MSTRHALSSGLLAATVVAVVAIASDLSLPHQFQAGTPARADEVNANFEALRAAVNDSAGRIAELTARLEALESCRGNGPADEMVRVGSLCIDKFEASIWSNADGTGTVYGNDSVAGDNYPASFPDNGNWSARLYAVSKAGVAPSRYVTWFQAQQACAASGKRLLTNAEWQMAAAGTPDDARCNVTGTFVVEATGGRPVCVSSWGVHDMVGNAWEWVADWMHGNATTWSPTTTNLAGYGGDLVAGIHPVQGSAVPFPGVLLRGGSSKEAGGSGVFTLSINQNPTQQGETVGFRCAR